VNGYQVRRETEYRGVSIQKSKKNGVAEGSEALAWVEGLKVPSRQTRVFEVVITDIHR
jgi:hypothetical protein